MRIAVIADDLTGALDTGVQFRQWGYTVQLTDTPEHSTAEVTITNTDTR
ncbi:MAG TPA: four-carbon acid sugar kinase family protein, partial [Patescibacteria group bacterium]|nr:four-carbon acid sugar kinase family protein [Patescibacteria group bacterium]